MDFSDFQLGPIKLIEIRTTISGQKIGQTYTLKDPRGSQRAWHELKSHQWSIDASQKS